MGRFPSGQRGQTVNLLAIAFEGSNPSLPKHVRDAPQRAPPSRGAIFLYYRIKDDSMPTDVFYADGLRFACQRCSNCCRHEPGYVFLSTPDVRRLAEALTCSQEVLVHKYCRRVKVVGFKRLSLKEKRNYDCIFWEDGGCTVYSHRPLQCQSFPFWSSSLSSPHAWEELSRSCPGIGKGPLHSREAIEEWVDRRVREGYYHPSTTGNG